MALRFVDSFDHYQSAQLASKWSSYSTVGYHGGISAGQGRNGTAAYYAGRTWTIRKILDAQTTWIIGCAFRHVGTVAWVFLESMDGTTRQIGVQINVDRTISVLRGTTVLATSETALSGDTWYYIELRTVIHNTTGEYELRVNGTAWLTATGANTRSSANNSADGIRIYSENFQFGYFDDLYICDGTGSSHNTFLGDCKVMALVPSGAGASTQWTPSAGANYECVDDATPDSDTTYVSSATAGHKDTYALGDLSGSGTILGVQSSYFARKDDAGSRTVKSVVRSGAGAESNGASVSVSDTYVYYIDLHATEPGGAAWTVAKVNDAQVGVEVVA